MWLQPEFQRYLIAGLFLIAGFLHFLKPHPFASIIPSFLPAHLVLVYISGAAEILGAIGILITASRSLAAWGLILLLIAVFPANINMCVQAVQNQGYTSWYSVMTIVRLPFQFVLIYWVYWSCLICE